MLNGAWKMLNVAWATRHCLSRVYGFSLCQFASGATNTIRTVRSLRRCRWLCVCVCVCHSLSLTHSLSHSLCVCACVRVHICICIVANSSQPSVKLH